MAQRPLLISQFQESRPIVDGQGRPLKDALRALNQLSAVVEQIYLLPDIQAAINAANNAAKSITSEQSIVNSYVTSFAGASPLAADSAGNVTVKNHTRVYGNTTLNPNVAITGTVLATGAASPTIIHVFYDDATRADTTPTFQFSTTQPVQGGDRHVIGAVEIPAAGTSDGGYVRPPGYTGPAP